MQDYPGARGVIWQVLYLPGEPARLLATTSDELFIWKLGEPVPIATFSWELTDQDDGRMHILALSPDGHWLLGANLTTIRVWDITTTVPTLRKTVEQRELLAASFNESSDEIWAVPRLPKWGILRAKLKGRKAFTFGAVEPLANNDEFDPNNFPYLSWLREAMVVSADGRYFAGSTRGRCSPVWDIRTGSCLGSVRTRRSPTRLSLSPDGHLFALDCGTTIYVHETTAFDSVCSWKTKYTYYPSLAWSPDATILARTDSSTTLRLFEVRTGRETAALTNKRGRNTAVAFAPDGLTCAVGTFDGLVRVWDVG